MSCSAAEHEEKQRQELIRLQGSFDAEDSEDESFDVPSLLSTAKQLQLMQQGKVVESPSHSNLDVAVQCLAELEPRGCILVLLEPCFLWLLSGLRL